MLVVFGSKDTKRVSMMIITLLSQVKRLSGGSHNIAIFEVIRLVIALFLAIITLIILLAYHHSHLAILCRKIGSTTTPILIVSG